MDNKDNQLASNTSSSEEHKGSSSSLTPKRELTVKNKLFLQGLLEGKPTFVAYTEAGYEGSKHAAYELRSSLKEDLIRALEAQGIDRAGLMLSLSQLMQLPLKENEISLKHKIDLLKLLAKTIPADQSANKPKITAFIVNTKVEPNSGSTTHIETTEA